MEDFLEILSVRRHNLLNHIQVISGYLQLNKIDRAKQYLVEMVDEITRESQLFSCRSGQVAVALICLQHIALLSGIKLSVDLKAALDTSSVPEGILTAIIRVYGLTLQEIQPPPKQGYEENCLFVISEQAKSLVWEFGIPSGQDYCQKFQDRVGLILGQEGMDSICSMQYFAGGVRLDIPKKL